MDLSVCKKNIIRKESGALLEFYIHNESVYCKKMNDESQKDVEIFKNVKTYDIAIDFKDNVHLLCVTNCGKLCYCIYASDKVKTNILKKYRPSINQIEKVNLFSIGRKMHMFYSFRKLSERNSKIVHIYLEGNKWRTNYLDIEISYDNGLRYMVDYNSKGDIFLIYKDLEKKSCIRIYYNSLKKWKDPIDLNLNNNIEFENMLVDSINNIHILFSFKNDKKKLNHIFKNTQDLLNDSSWVKYTFDKVEHEYNLKIFEFNRNIFIAWNINNTINIRNSIGDILKWEMTKQISLSDIQSINYIGRKYKNRNIGKCIDSLGIIEGNDINLICIDKGLVLKEYKEENIEKEECKKEEGKEETKKEVKEEAEQEVIKEIVEPRTQLDSEKITEKEININNGFRSYKEEEKESFVDSLKKYFKL